MVISYGSNGRTRCPRFATNSPIWGEILGPVRALAGWAANPSRWCPTTHRDARGPGAAAYKPDIKRVSWSSSLADRARLLCSSYSRDPGTTLIFYVPFSNLRLEDECEELEHAPSRASSSLYLRLSYDITSVWTHTQQCPDR